MLSEFVKQHLDPDIWETTEIFLELKIFSPLHPKRVIEACQRSGYTAEEPTIEMIETFYNCLSYSAKEYLFIHTDHLGDINPERIMIIESMFKEGKLKPAFYKFFARRAKALENKDGF